MVALGYLTYYNGKFSIPNKRIIKKIYENSKSRKKNLAKLKKKLMNRSEEIVYVPLNKETKKICKIFEELHLSDSDIKNRYNHVTLSFFLSMLAYQYAENNYDIGKEQNSGKGVVDYIFYPKDKRKTAFIIKLKVGGSAKEVINQIYEQMYILLN